MASNTVVQTNVLALNSHRNLGMVGNVKAKSSQKLSSGYKINSAADDAAGLAISEKMRAQIRGLDGAAKNTQDAISLIQTAEGGMSTINDMVKRVRDLVETASNDTQDQSTTTDNQGDRQKIQDEIDQLMQEIDSMASRVEFNKKKLIDGSYAEGNTAAPAGAESFDAVIDALDAKYRDLSVAATVADVAFSAAATALESAVSTVATAISAANTSTLLTVGMADDTGLSAVRTAIQSLLPASASTLTTAGVADLREGALKLLNDKIASMDPDDLTDTQKADAAKAINDYFDNVSRLVGKMETSIASYKAASAAMTAASANITGFSATITGAASLHAAISAVQSTANGVYESALSTAQTANPSLTEAEFQKQFFNNIDDYYKDATAAQKKELNEFKKVLGALDLKLGSPGTPAANTLWFQIGANAGQGMYLNINGVTTKELFGDSGTQHLDARKGTQKSAINVMDVTGNGEGVLGDEVDENKSISGLLKKIDKALTMVTTERSKLGAAQNRLEYANESLQVSSENLSNAESGIRDTDMAKEMMKLTKSNIIQQAAISMLAQANQAPQSILSLLQ